MQAQELFGSTASRETKLGRFDSGSAPWSQIRLTKRNPGPSSESRVITPGNSPPHSEPGRKRRDLGVVVEEVANAVEDVGHDVADSGESAAISREGTRRAFNPERRAARRGGKTHLRPASLGPQTRFLVAGPAPLDPQIDGDLLRSG